MGKKVLIVDDSALIRSILTEIIHGATDHTVVGEAENGKLALNAYIKLRPDMVFMDAIMPEMDGFQALKALIQLDPKAKVIMCSAEQKPDDLLHALQSGAKDFILKPFDPDRVARCLNRDY